MVTGCRVEHLYAEINPLQAGSRKYHAGGDVYIVRGGDDFFVGLQY
jgi:hypothetical protein